MILKKKQSKEAGANQTARQFSERIFLKQLKNNQNSQLKALQHNAQAIQMAFAEQQSDFSFKSNEDRVVWPDVVVKSVANL